MPRLAARRIGLALGCTLPALWLYACNAESPSPSSERNQTATVAAALTTGPELPSRWERTVPWGETDSGLRLHAGGFEDPTRGPDAVAVAPTGVALVLDQLGERVIAVGAEGEPFAVVAAPLDAMDLLAGPDGALAIWSKVRARAWVHGATGDALGEMVVPRSFMFPQRLSMGTRGSLQIHTDAQHTIMLGSPSAPLHEWVARKSRRFGAALLPDGRGLFVHVQKGQAVLQVLDQPDEKHDRPRVHARWDIPGEVDAARIVGAYQNTTCLRLEDVESSPKITVERRSLCLDGTSGEVLLDEALPPPGIYTPHTELAMNGDRLAFIRAGKEGLRVVGWRVPVADEEVSP
jgi:hypothetical protein